MVFQGTKSPQNQTALAWYISTFALAASMLLDKLYIQLQLLIQSRSLTRSFPISFYWPLSSLLNSCFIMFALTEQPLHCILVNGEDVDHKQKYFVT